MASRLAASALAVAAVALAVVLAARSPASADGPHPLSIVGPDGPVWNGTADGGDALAVLLDGARQGGFGVVVTGAGATAYVRSIAGHAESDGGGWCFDVYDQGWRTPGQGAAVTALGPDQAVRWRWAPACGEPTP